MTARPPGAVRSPCVAVCRIEPDSGLCAGCLRTIDEIAAWGSMGESQRDQVWRALERRKAARAGHPAIQPVAPASDRGAMPAACADCSSRATPDASPAAADCRRCA